jgi:hypothetical protein
MVELSDFTVKPTEDPMTEKNNTLVELLQKSGEGDFLRSVAEAVLQILMEADVEGVIGAGRYERSGDRLTYRNGYRDRRLDTRLGSLQLRIPKLRQGTYFSPFLEPRRTSEKALAAVIQEAWIGGVSTRRVEELVQAMGLAGISKSQVSKLCKDIDERVNAFLERPIEGEWRYLWLDATYLKQREGGRIVSVAAIIAVAAGTDGPLPERPFKWCMLPIAGISWRTPVPPFWKRSGDPCARSAWRSEVRLSTRRSSPMPSACSTTPTYDGKRLTASSAL